MRGVVVPPEALERLLEPSEVRRMWGGPDAPLGILKKCRYCELPNDLHSEECPVPALQESLAQYRNTVRTEPETLNANQVLTVNKGYMEAKAGEWEIDIFLSQNTVDSYTKDFRPMLVFQVYGPGYEGEGDYVSFYLLPEKVRELHDITGRFMEMPYTAGYPVPEKKALEIAAELLEESGNDDISTRCVEQAEVGSDKLRVARYLRYLSGEDV